MYQFAWQTISLRFTQNLKSSELFHISEEHSSSYHDRSWPSTFSHACTSMNMHKMCSMVITSTISLFRDCGFIRHSARYPSSSHLHRYTLSCSSLLSENLVPIISTIAADQWIGLSPTLCIVSRKFLTAFSKKICQMNASLCLFKEFYYRKCLSVYYKVLHLRQ